MDSKKVLIVVALIAVVGAIAYFLPLSKPKPNLVVSAWTNQPEYFTTTQTNQYCNNGGPVLFKVYSSIKNSDGNIVTDASVVGQVYFANSSKFGGEIQPHYNSTSQLWESNWLYSGCMSTGNFSINVIATKINMTGTGTYQFAVRESA